MKDSYQSDQKKLIEGYIKGSAREFFIVTNWIDQVVNHYSWGLRDFSEDIVQDVRLKLYMNLKHNKFRSASQLKTYVYRIAKYTCIDFLRKKMNQSAYEPDSSAIEANGNPLEDIIENEKKVILQRILNELASMCREMLELVLGEKQSYNEIGKILNIAEGTVKSRVSRCIKKAIELREKYWNDSQTNTTR